MTHPDNLDLTAEQMRDWIAYSNIEPWGDTRADIHNAQLCTLIANVNRDPKKPAFKLEQFLLKNG